MRVKQIFLGLGLVVAVAGCSPMVYTHGVPNLAHVSGGIWRSGQITTPEGWQYIREIAAGRAIHVVKLNFDNEGSDAGAAAIGATIHALPIQPQGDRDWWSDVIGVFVLPDPRQLAEAERLLEGATDRDFWLVHCTHGQDRTGLVVGRYRVLHDHWTKRQAYEEMLAHHFHAALHGVHEAWERFVP